ncbi:MAG TPA: hypothetical protein VK153_01780 [Candidatus Paceibacterota bacterium]|nr:hypothetical protein [Candidatus Paceibacterota bacterium]
MAKEKNNYQFWHSPIVLFFLFAFLLFFGYKIIDLLKINIETSHKKEVKQLEIDDLKKRELSLSRDIAKLETEEGKEEIIRSKYPVTKPGEKMVSIIEEEGNVPLEDSKTSHGFWNWLKKVFNK